LHPFPNAPYIQKQKPFTALSRGGGQVLDCYELQKKVAALCTELDRAIEGEQNVAVVLPEEHGQT
jgi:hypothetical protein